MSADEIVAVAGVTRGALYHHYKDKQDLFRAVFVAIETEMNDELVAAVRAAPDLPTQMVVAIVGFLDICERPEVIRIALTDAPAVLGWQAWREIESEHGLGLITEHLQAAADSDLLVPVPVPVLARLVLSAAIEAALVVAHAEKREAARADAQQTLLVLLSGLLTHRT